MEIVEKEKVEIEKGIHDRDRVWILVNGKHLAIALAPSTPILGMQEYSNTC